LVYVEIGKIFLSKLVKRAVFSEGAGQNVGAIDVVVSVVLKSSAVAGWTHSAASAEALTLRKKDVSGRI
jgi:hypothetical protein